MTQRSPLRLLGALLEFNGRDRPLSVMSIDRDSHAVKFVQPDIRNCPGFSIGKNDSFPDKFRLHVPQRVEDRRREELHSRHGVPEVSPASESAGPLLPLKDVQVVTGTGPSSDRKNPADSSISEGQPPISLEMSGNQIVRTSASADVDLRRGGAYQITVAIERTQKARLIGAGVRLNSSQRVFAYEE